MTADLLASASLALTALTVLFALWSADVNHARRLERKPHRGDRDPAVAEIRRTQRQKAAPLMAATVAVTLVLVPPVVEVVGSSASRVQGSGLSALKRYQAEQALFLVVWLLLVGLALVTFGSWRALRAKALDFERPDSDGDRD